MIPSIFHQIFYGLSGFWKQLYLIKNDDGLPFKKSNSRNCLQPEKKEVNSAYVIKTVHDLSRSFGKIYQYVRLILMPGKFFSNRRLSDSPGAFQKDCISVRICFLPFQQFIVCFSFKIHMPPPLIIKRIAYYLHFFNYIVSHYIYFFKVFCGNCSISSKFWNNARCCGT